MRERQRNSLAPLLSASLRLCVFLLLVVHPARAAEHVILYFSRAASVRQVFAQDRPELQKILADGGMAAMTIGPPGDDPLATIRAGRYVDPDAPAETAGFPPGVVPLFEPPGDPAPGEAMLKEARVRYPGAPVLALHAGPMVPPGSHGIAASLSVPSWVAISSMRGRLYSDTTRRAGIVSNLDVLPTLRRQLEGETPADTPGAPMWGEPPGRRNLRHGLPAQVAATMSLQDALLAAARATNPVNFTLAFAGIVLFFAGAYLLATHRVREGRWVRYLLLAVLVAPMAVGLASARLPASLPALLALSLAATAGLTVLAAALGRAMAYARADALPAALLLITGGVAVWLLSATWRGNIALAVSPITNLYLTGVRFYGLGNEYAALLIGCGVVAGLLTVQRVNPRAVSPAGLLALGVWFLAISYVIGWPRAGANMGGMLTGVITGGIAWYLAARRSGYRFAWIWPLLAAIALVALVVWTDAHSPHATHIGRFVRAAADSPQTPLAMLAGKTGIQWRLLTAPPAFVIYIAALALVFLARGPLAPARARLFLRWPWAGIAVPSLLVGGGFGMLLNDTGIVMWGLMAGVALASAAVLALEPAPTLPSGTPDSLS